MAADREGRRRRRWVIGIVVVIAVLAGAIVGGLVVSSQSSSAAPAITLVPANTPGPDPFTPPVTTGPATGDAGSVGAAVRGGLRTDPNTKTLVAAGTAPGLYGGSGDVHVCDAQKLVTFLNANPAKARAWADVFHLAPRDIASYVATLTPVVLTNDTLVINHGYHNGVATSLTSVLQAGTAVMVDRTGTPRVKCNCGNPLLPPVPVNLSSATLRGPRWTDYAPATVTIIEAGTTVHSFTLTNVRTGGTYVEPAGTDSGGGGGAGAQWVATEVSSRGSVYTAQTTILTSRDGSTWTQAGTVAGENLSGLAWGDGRWIAVAQGDYGIGTGTHILESRDLVTWTMVASAPETLIGVAHTDGQWIAVGSWPAGVAVGGVDHATPAAYTSTDGASWTQVDEVPDGPDDGSNMRGLVSVAHGEKGWAAVRIDQTTPASGAAPSYQMTTLTSADGSTWNLVGPGVDVGDGRTVIAHAEGGWAEAMTQKSGQGVLSTGSDGTSWSPVAKTPFGPHPVSGLAAGDGRWLAVSAPALTSDASIPANPVSTFFTSTEAKKWKQAGQLQAEVTAIAYGGSATASTSTSTTAPSGATTAGQAPCTREALQDAFGHETDDDMDTAILNSNDPPICSNGWAAVHYWNQGMHSLAVFRTNGSTWTRPVNDLSTTYPRDPIPLNADGYVEGWHSLCTDPQFPKALHVYACPGQ